MSMDTRTAFLSTPSARRATTLLLLRLQQVNIFLSTPSARRATACRCSPASMISSISIHALREEGDLLPEEKQMNLPDISIHALREEGDLAGASDCKTHKTFLSTPSARRATLLPFCLLKTLLFLSTPSARRATAKTERKPSAFVSLYTSLHKLQRGACKTNRKITPLLVQTAGIPVRSVRENHVRCLFALAGHQKISTLSCANSGCSPTCSTLVW